MKKKRILNSQEQQVIVNKTDASSSARDTDKVVQKKTEKPVPGMKKKKLN